MDSTAEAPYNGELIFKRILRLLSLLSVPRLFAQPAHIEAFPVPFDVPEEEATHFAVWVNEEPFGLYSINEAPRSKTARYLWGCGQ